MNVSRRMFLGGAIALVGAAVLPKGMQAHPVIYGDGVHDDWAGLDALWHGRPVQIIADGVSVSDSREIYMRYGHFLVSKTLYVPPGARITIQNSILEWKGGTNPFLYLEDGTHFLPHFHHSVTLQT